MIRSILTVSLGTLASRLLGFVRDSMIAALLGAGPVADAFLVAFQLVNVVRRLLTEGALGLPKELTVIEILETVRCAHDDDLGTGGEAVELDEQLVERLVLLTVEAVSTTGGADGVELVDEDDRWRVVTRLFEQLADARGAETGEHLDERRRALRIEVRA